MQTLRWYSVHVTLLLVEAYCDVFSPGVPVSPTIKNMYIGLSLASSLDQGTGLESEARPRRCTVAAEDALSLAAQAVDQHNL